MSASSTIATLASALPSASAAVTDVALARPDAGAAPVEDDTRDELEKIAEGSPPPPLPASAPASVRFGAILFTYRGAQLAAAEGRTKIEARNAALAALKDAEVDFAEAAKKGDAGSTADAGEMPRGILEPHLEYVLFTLPRKAVFEHPIDSPRGYLLVKRL